MHACSDSLTAGSMVVYLIYSNYTAQNFCQPQVGWYLAPHCRASGLGFRVRVVRQGMICNEAGNEST